MKNLLPILPLLLPATEAHARVIHTNSDTGPILAIVLSIVATVGLTFIVRILRRR